MGDSSGQSSFADLAIVWSGYKRGSGSEGLCYIPGCLLEEKPHLGSDGAHKALLTWEHEQGIQCTCSVNQDPCLAGNDKLGGVYVCAHVCVPQFHRLTPTQPAIDRSWDTPAAYRPAD